MSAARERSERRPEGPVVARLSEADTPDSPQAEMNKEAE